MIKDSRSKFSSRCFYLKMYDTLMAPRTLEIAFCAFFMEPKFMPRTNRHSFLQGESERSTLRFKTFRRWNSGRLCGIHDNKVTSWSRSTGEITIKSRSWIGASDPSLESLFNLDSITCSLFTMANIFADHKSWRNINEVSNVENIKPRRSAPYCVDRQWHALHVKQSGGMIEIDRVPARVFRSLPSRTQRLSV